MSGRIVLTHDGIGTRLFLGRAVSLLSRVARFFFAKRGAERGKIMWRLVGVATVVAIDAAAVALIWVML